MSFSVKSVRRIYVLMTGERPAGFPTTFIFTMFLYLLARYPKKDLFKNGVLKNGTRFFC